ncbi:MAG: hypothetical protein K2X93_05385 [Candidatus Obscuribacterales bacterium]|nr:hypothetical protein [Candidatus Obscuribacterales bacterium]
MNFFRKHFLSTQVQVVLSTAVLAVAVFLYSSTDASTSPSSTLSAFQTEDIGLKLFILFGMALLFPAALSTMIPAREVNTTSESHTRLEQIGQERHVDDGDQIFPIAFEFAPAAERQTISQRIQVNNLMVRLSDAATSATTSDIKAETEPFSNTESAVAAGIAQLEGTPSLYENCDMMFRCIHLHGMLAFSRSSVDETMAASSYERAFELYRKCEDKHPEETRNDSHEIMIYLLLKRYSSLLSRMGDADSIRRSVEIKMTLDQISARRLNTVAQQQRSDHGTPTFAFQKPQIVGSSRG